MNEFEYEKLLHIQTTGEQQWDSKKNTHNHPYQTTPYEALALLLQNHRLTEQDRLVDFGCGKARLPFFIDYFTKASAIGIEIDSTLFQQAQQNLMRYFNHYPSSLASVELINTPAQDYIIQGCDNHFYFFNPFSLPIFQKVVYNIIDSVTEESRTVYLILYYPSTDYIDFLKNQTRFQLKEEILIPGRYNKDTDERFLIYQL